MSAYACCDNFSTYAHRIMEKANEEAKRLCHAYVGTEHILLGLLCMAKTMPSLAAVKILRNFDVDFAQLSARTEALVGRGQDTVFDDQLPLPLTPHAQKVIAHASTEAHCMGMTFVCSEHILLGLLREYSVAALAFRRSGLTLDDVQRAAEAINA